MAESSLATHLVACSGGLDTQSSVLTMGRPQYNGYARRLINFEPWRGYRRITGVTQYGDTTGFTSFSSAVVRSVAVFNDGIVCARDTGLSKYKLYGRAPADIAWSAIGELSVTTMPRIIRHKKIGFSGAKVVFVDGQNPAQSWDGTSLVALNGSGAPADPSIVSEFKNRLVLGGYSAGGGHNIIISAPNDEATYSGGAGAIEINIGDTVVAVHSFRDELIIFCNNRISKIMGDNSTNFTLLPIARDMGCKSADSVVEIGGLLYFWSGDGVRQISTTDKIADTEMAVVTKTIDKTIEDLVASGHDLSKVIAVPIVAKTQFRMFFSDSSILEEGARGILGAWALDVVTQQSSFDFAELLGINPSCAAQGYIQGNEYVMHGGFDGNVYRQELGNNIHGNPIQAVYQSPFIDIGDPFVRKQLYRMIFYTELEGDVKYYLNVSFDFGDETIVQPANLMLQEDYVTSNYGDANSKYGTAIYGAQQQPLMLSNFQGSCKTVSIGVTSVDDQASFHIMGFGIEYSNEGRDQ